MSGSRILIELVIVLGSAAAITIVFHALRLPAVLGYVAAGIVIGPHVPSPLVASTQLVRVLSQLGIILLLFTIGLELRVSRLARLGPRAGLATLIEVGGTAAVGMLAARLLGWAPREALFLGACLGVSSTMLVATAFEDLGWRGPLTELAFAILVFEDLIAIGLLASLSAVASGANLAGRELVVVIVRLAGLLAVISVVGMLVVPRAFRWLARHARHDTLLISALGLCFGVSVLVQEAGYSVALGAFLAGVLVAESGQGRLVQAAVRPFRDVFAMIFFVSIGMMVDPAEIVAHWPAILVFTGLVLLAKPLTAGLAIVLGGSGLRPAVQTGLSLAQIGELSFVIAGIAVHAGIAGRSLIAIVAGVSSITALVAPQLMRRSDRIATWVDAHLPRRISTYLCFYEAWLERLRGRQIGLWPRIRRRVIVLVVEATAAVTTVIAVTTRAPRLVDGIVERVGMSPGEARALITVATLALVLPLLFGVMRAVVVIAHRLALEVIPAGGPVDLGRAPRRALSVTIQLALALMIGAPIAAVTEPFVPGGPLLIVAAIAVLVLAARRSIADLDGHVRAGSELLLQVLARQGGHDIARVEEVLPGFSNLASVELVHGSSSIGRRLGELDLRATTGATVLVLMRDGQGILSPEGSEVLQVGDVLALTGSEEALGRARERLLSKP